MRIDRILEKKMTFSFEVFPPKNDQPLEPLRETLDQLSKFKPDFISVTYGAGGTNKGRNNEVCMEILDRDINLMSHFTCIGNSKEDVFNRVTKFENMGGENLLALRGDLPDGWNCTGGEYKHADSLIEALTEQFPNMCLAGACYPEKHIEAKTFDSDIAHMRSKQNNGAKFFVTQLCYDTEAFERFLIRCEKAGIDVPIIVGVMPVLYKNGVLRMTTSNGCSIPAELADIIGKYGEKPDEFKKAGKEYTKELIYKYMSLGIDGLHVYSLNKYKDLAEIINDSGIRGSFDLKK